MIQMTITGDAPHEFLANLLGVARAMVPPAQPREEVMPADQPAPVSTGPAPTGETGGAKRRGRPPKAQTASEAGGQPPAEQVASDAAMVDVNNKPIDPTDVIPPEQPEVPTKEQLRHALEKVSAEDKLGPAAAFQILVDAGYQMVSAVEPDKRAAIIAIAKAKLAEVDAQADGE